MRGRMLDNMKHGSVIMSAHLRALAAVSGAIETSLVAIGRFQPENRAHPRNKLSTHDSNCQKAHAQINGDDHHSQWYARPRRRFRHHLALASKSAAAKPSAAMSKHRIISLPRRHERQLQPPKSSPRRSELMTPCSAAVFMMKCRERPKFFALSRTRQEMKRESTLQADSAGANEEIAALLLWLPAISTSLGDFADFIMTRRILRAPAVRRRPISIWLGDRPHAMCRAPANFSAKSANMTVTPSAQPRGQLYGIARGDK